MWKLDDVTSKYRMTMFRKRLRSIMGRPGYQATVPATEIHTPVDIINVKLCTHSISFLHYIKKNSLRNSPSYNIRKNSKGCNSEF